MQPGTYSRGSQQSFPGKSVCREATAGKVLSVDLLRYDSAQTHLQQDHRL